MTGRSDTPSPVPSGRPERLTGGGAGPVRGGVTPGPARNAPALDGMVWGDVIGADAVGAVLVKRDEADGHDLMIIVGTRWLRVDRAAAEKLHRQIELMLWPMGCAQ